MVIYKGLRMCLEPRSAQEYFEAIVARSAVSGAKGIKIFLTLRNFCRDSCIASCHTPPYPLFQHQWAAPHQCQNKFCRWLRLAPLVYLRGGDEGTTSLLQHPQFCGIPSFVTTSIDVKAWCSLIWGCYYSPRSCFTSFSSSPWATASLMSRSISLRLKRSLLSLARKT